MIFEKWHGVFDPKGELLAVEEGLTMATAAAIALSVNAKATAATTENTTDNVTILRGNLLDFVLTVIESAKLRARELELEDIAEKVRQAKTLGHVEGRTD